MKNIGLILLAIVFTTVVNLGYAHFYLLPRLEHKTPPWSAEIKQIINEGQHTSPRYGVPSTVLEATEYVCGTMQLWDNSNRLDVLFNDVEQHADMAQLISDTEIDRIRQRALANFANTTLQAADLTQWIKCSDTSEPMSIPALLHMHVLQTRKMLKDKSLLLDNFEQRSRQAALSTTKVILASQGAYPVKSANASAVRFLLRRVNLWGFPLGELGFSAQEIALLKE